MSNTLSVKAIRGQAGIGLRTEHVHQILDLADNPANEESNSHLQTIPWVELLVDNWLADGGLTRRYYDAIVEQYPLTLHGVGLSLGGTEPLDFAYLSHIKKLMQNSHVLMYSEHLCFSQLNTYYSHDLLPLPYTDEVVEHIASRIKLIQDFLGCQLVVENVSSYVEYKQSYLTEGEFLATIATESDCGLLVDVNNFYVNQVNHKKDALQQMLQLPTDRVRELHLAGFADKGDYVIDAHNNPVAADVWDLYEKALQLFGNIPTLIEWDNDIPELEVLLAERKKAQRFLDQIAIDNYKDGPLCA